MARRPPRPLAPETDLASCRALAIAMLAALALAAALVGWSAAW